MASRSGNRLLCYEVLRALEKLKLSELERQLLW
jgi:hypothetical protein